MYAVMIQDFEDYIKPELCFQVGTNDVAIYDDIDTDQELIEYLVDNGFERENYFIVELKRI